MAQGILGIGISSEPYDRFKPMIVGATVALSHGLSPWIDKTVVAPNGNETLFVRGDFEDLETFYQLVLWNNLEPYEEVVFDLAVLTCCKDEALLLYRLSCICPGPIHVPINDRHLSRLDTIMAPLKDRTYAVRPITEFQLYKRNYKEVAQEFFDCHHTRKIKTFLKQYNFHQWDIAESDWKYLKISARLN
jgi:hypothetical protein